MKETEKNYQCNPSCVEEPQRKLELKLPLGFQLEKAVCSHGLFMLAPNHWDPLSNTLTRPLRLQHHPSSSIFVSISQQLPTSLSVRVHGTHSLSLEQQRDLLAQVSRMLRLSDAEEKAVAEFSNMRGDRGDDHVNRSFCGRVFRSPTLWEDMVKCILICHCQWSRTLSMAQALCELQLELQNGSSNTVAVSSNSNVETDGFFPKTPAAKELRRIASVSTKGSLPKKKLELEGNEHLEVANGEDYFNHVGNFPSPNELANLDERLLAERCKVGYRAPRIIKLAQNIVEGKIQLEQLEELSKDGSLSSYKQLEDQLKLINGFGSFTVANVLMCMGYYHVIPTDSETVRHVNQLHSRKSTLRTIQKDVEIIYGKYEPYQFLAYWSEIWDFYESIFGKMNEMHRSDYKLITASNMKNADNGKVMQLCSRNMDSGFE